MGPRWRTHVSSCMRTHFTLHRVGEKLGELWPHVHVSGAVCAASTGKRKLTVRKTIDPGR